MNNTYKHVYECGNFGNEDQCPHCGADPREDTPSSRYNTVTVTCSGWYDD